MTCDAWQASNTDAYFAVTAHWIEVIDGIAVNQAALIGFVRLNYAHHGVRLGQALFKIAQRVGIISKASFLFVLMFIPGYVLYFADWLDYLR